MQPVHRVDKYIELSEWLAFDCRNPELALEWIDKALAYEPENPEALAVKGDILQTLERFEQAVQYYDRVLEMAPDAVGAIAEKAQALCALERWEEALKVADEGLAMMAESGVGDDKPELRIADVTLLEAKAHALYALEREDESRAVLEEGLRRYPDNEILSVPLEQMDGEEDPPTDE